MRLSRNLSCFSALLTLGGAVAAASVQAAPEATPFPISTLKKLIAGANLNPILKVADLPPAVRVSFRERMPIYDLNTPQGQQPRVIGYRDVDMADPGQPWVSGCIIDSTKPLPRQQLQFAGVVNGRCFVVYDTGGFAHMQHIALFRLDGDKAISLGSMISRFEDKDLAALRRDIAKKEFAVRL